MLSTARFYTMAADEKLQEAVAFARSHLAPLVKDNADRTHVMKINSLICSMAASTCKPRQKSAHALMPGMLQAPAAETIACGRADCASGCAPPSPLGWGLAQLHQLLQHQCKGHRGHRGCLGHS